MCFWYAVVKSASRKDKGQGHGHQGLTDACEKTKASPSGLIPLFAEKVNAAHESKVSGYTVHHSL